MKTSLAEWFLEKIATAAEIDFMKRPVPSNTSERETYYQLRNWLTEYREAKLRDARK